jgi:hypothetical protein
VIEFAEPCWFVERNDPWEIQHFATLLAAGRAHVDSVREHHGYPWSVAHIFAEISPATITRCPEPCIEFTCPECGTTCHRFAAECARCVCCTWSELAVTSSSSNQKGK